MNEEDVFWGRCSHDSYKFSEKSSFRFKKPFWRKENTCSHCGGMRPSIALKAIREGAEVVPTDKNYKIYVEGVNLPGCPANKCYLNHFSESQAVEFVLLWHNKKMNIAYPGSFYRGLCFGCYKEAIEKAINTPPPSSENIS
jgi:hypothetical protein